MPVSKLSSLTLNQIPKEVFLVLGGISGSNNDAFESHFDPVVAKRIPNNEKILIGPNNVWQSGKYYTPYSINVTSNHYVLNSSNNVVYLCVSNNSNNDTLTLVNVSSVIPSHTTPTIAQSDDGYSWIPIFRIDPAQYKFISDRDLPLSEISSIEVDYNSFTEKFQPLCGSGITSFGCCCLYFKENSVDEITAEVYSQGDVTNETIFSDCYECQKLADALDREVIFLSGQTAGSITSSSTGENPLCPATKTIQTIAEQLESNKYITIPGSSNEFAYNLISNFTNSAGILFARIDLTGITTAYRQVTTSNPSVTIIDPTGSGAVVNLKTVQISEYLHEVVGIQMTSSGSGYDGIPDHKVDGLVKNHPLNNAISLDIFPEGMFEQSTQFVSPTSYKIITSITTDSLLDVIASPKLTKYAILTDPLYYDSAAPVKYTKNNADYFTLEEKVLCGQCGNPNTANNNIIAPTISGLPRLYPSQVTSSQVVSNSSNSGYSVYISAIKQKLNGQITYYNGPNAVDTTGVALYTTDTKNSIALGDTILIGQTSYRAVFKDPPIIDKISGKYVSSGLLENAISNTLTETTKSYSFNISINTV